MPMSLLFLPILSLVVSVENRSPEDLRERRAVQTLSKGSVAAGMHCAIT